MDDAFGKFEGIVRSAWQITETPLSSPNSGHAFELRNIHPKLPPKCRKLFDDAHFSESTFEAAKFLDKTVQKISGEKSSGRALMMSVFGGNTPKLPLNLMQTATDQDEQEGYKFIFSGVMAAIRNPRGHEFNFSDDVDTCLEHLSLISLLIRRLEAAGILI